VDQTTGERVLNVKTVAHAQDKPRKFKARKADSAGAQAVTDGA
jgi:hypothetical protein